MKRNDYVAHCYATEPTGEVLAQDIWKALLRAEAKIAALIAKSR